MGSTENRNRRRPIIMGGVVFNRSHVGNSITSTHSKKKRQGRKYRNLIKAGQNVQITRRKLKAGRHHPELRK